LQTKQREKTYVWENVMFPMQSIAQKHSDSFLMYIRILEILLPVLVFPTYYQHKEEGNL